DPGRSGVSADVSSRFIEESVRWLNLWIRGDGDLSSMAPVRVFVTGSNAHWEERKEWPDSEDGLIMYLGKGTLSKHVDMVGAKGSSDDFVYDPNDPVPTEGGAVWAFPKAGLQPGPSVSSIFERPDVLVYDYGPLEEPLKILGNPRVTLYASSSAPDTDFVAGLFDVDSNGVSRYVSDGIVRGRYRNGVDKEELLELGKTNQFIIPMKACAHTFAQGHSIRLTISSSNFPKFDRNHNTKMPLFQSREMEKAVQTVYYGGDNPSVLVLPLSAPVPGDETCGGEMSASGK
nr:CocE/NonD family hydrolase [Bacillota bacterium]